MKTKCFKTTGHSAGFKNYSSNLFALSDEAELFENGGQCDTGGETVQLLPPGWIHSGILSVSQLCEKLLGGLTWSLCEVRCCSTVLSLLSF